MRRILSSNHISLRKTRLKWTNQTHVLVPEELEYLLSVVERTGWTPAIDFEVLTRGGVHIT